ncbi:MAG: hypothetical protein A2W80_08205 [Candidatus Riflebacteria bacterium GWC2_50_8]|nr:MAG: hypothetical protein A2W80_08205 [Candidatus Riflebacteria bacterium GWC2_50_8]
MDKRWPFFTVDLELTNICEQNCSFCPREKITRPSGFIDMQLLADILRQLAAMGSRVTFCGMGNPMLHPQWHEISDICHNSGLKYGLTIQAPALDAQNIARISMLAPSFIEISFPTIDSGHFSQIYPGQDIELCLRALDDLVSMRGSARGISVIAVRTADEPVSAEATSVFWQNRGLSLRQQQCHSRGSNLTKNVVTRRRAIEACGLFATHSFITWQGRLLACCHDLNGASEIADLNQVLLTEAAQTKIEILQHGMPWPLCSKCDEPAATRPLPDRAYPETAKAQSRYLKRLCASD